MLFIVNIMILCRSVAYNIGLQLQCSPIDRVVPTLVDITSGEYLSNHVIEDSSISIVHQFHVSIKANFDLKTSTCTDL